MIVQDNKYDTPYTLKIRCGCQGGGKGALIQENKNATLATNNDQTLFAPADRQQSYIVRRLTPLECERLQGFPDLWTDIGAYTDSKGKQRKTFRWCKV